MNFKDLEGKKVKLTYINGFRLDGYVLAADEHGIIFQTDQGTSVVMWHSVQDLKLWES